MTRIEEVIHEHLANAGQDKLEAVFHAIDDKVRIQAMQSALDDLIGEQGRFQESERKLKGAVREALDALEAGDVIKARIVLRSAVMKR